jgi:hypothetical protein
MRASSITLRTRYQVELKRVTQDRAQVEALIKELETAEFQPASFDWVDLLEKLPRAGCSWWKSGDARNAIKAFLKAGVKRLPFRPLVTAHVPSTLPPAVEPMRPLLLAWTDWSQGHWNFHSVDVMLQLYEKNKGDGLSCARGLCQAYLKELKRLQKVTETLLSRNK